MNSLLERVQAMHEQFGIDHQSVETVHMEEGQFRYSAFVEEASEFITATINGDAAEQLDALVDLTVFTMGAVERFGFADIFDEAFKRVMDANCAKVVGPNQKRGSYKLDLQKPEGWQAADLLDLVEVPRD